MGVFQSANEPSGGSSSPVAEFGKWLSVVCLLAILSSIIGVLLSKVFGVSKFLGGVLFSGIWTVFSAGEAWIQFSDPRRRCLWMLGGFLAGLTVFFQLDWERISRYSSFAFLVPASFEYWAAFEVRDRAWTRVVATPLLYGLMPLWGPVFFDGTERMIGMLAANSTFSITIPLEVSGLAAFFGVILVTRAAIGSFIASKEVVW
jgi:hypothetical protein